MPHRLTSSTSSGEALALQKATPKSKPLMLQIGATEALCLGNAADTAGARLATAPQAPLLEDLSPNFYTKLLSCTRNCNKPSIAMAHGFGRDMCGMRFKERGSESESAREMEKYRVTDTAKADHPHEKG